MPGICVIHAENSSATCLKCPRGHIAVFRDGLDCSGKQGIVLPTGCPHSMGLLAGIGWKKSQRPCYIFPRAGVGVANDWFTREM